VKHYLLAFHHIRNGIRIVDIGEDDFQLFPDFRLKFFDKTGIFLKIVLYECSDRGALYSRAIRVSDQSFE